MASLVETGVGSRLAGSAALTALVSANQITFWERFQGESLPAVVIHRTYTEHVHSTSGSSGSGVCGIQIDCLGTSVVEAKNIAEQVRLLLQGYNTTFDSGTYRYRVASIQSEFDNFLTPAHAETESVPCVTQEYRVYFEEAVPS